MLNKILADLIVLVHFFWILFMLSGFILTLSGFFWKRFFAMRLFRLLHLFGIIYVALLAILDEYCPLTILENNLRAKYKSSLTYPGSFIAHYLERVVYPDVNPLIIIIPTIFIALFTIAIFILRPPKNFSKKPQQS
ncbi:MAG: hypothetical protein CO162_07290 [bacterium (Candidatus Ratteibacteria) CG_4_9_14_3_um_filter_41_21]|uniref:DUF2784 domain-containing protein n=2 Tax=Candidatus Ratteibacteria TaxID=2979319 RepID=A0A2M7EAV2_9BACT|nr:MAG: hypothetical protein AUJ76_03340 [Candidatus Omnitrophica bacterium CG1_02_41_171]PIV64814.1 MAG: hypothetical protein COS11_00215 [bacterium (Candidatus Ratteibacteria) CG01_land_8_20_14_3_00_40_19]PIW73845.1 MAG: hypothetical protein CO004_03805 [bacterium (Candidatus Ratteibacteria) CG_4_8_14_3_um_filter_41_36]PIX89331.1 MAG: hypothetical protein COZ31_02600 [Nitrospirae bacterium CG_4_10_14_3_um_filter_44_29]PJA61255.1 MAG: hypothetical protein CO162_07290 [bacterium (Candidatus Rat